MAQKSKIPSNRQSICHEGFRYLPTILTRTEQIALLREIELITCKAPLYTPRMPGSGKPFSVAMTNCGQLGWIADRSGYRYQSTHPETGQPWPAIPATLLSLWAEYAGVTAPPEACLVNYYATKARLGSHVDADEMDDTAPVLSISLGDDATFHIGGLKRSDPKTRLTLRSGDIVILGGTSRRAYHGIDRIRPGTSDLLPTGGRYNLTLRRVTRPVRTNI